MSSASKSRRPGLSRKMNPDALRDFYWLKDELAEFCRKLDLPSTGRKEDILRRLETYLRNPQASNPQDKGASVRRRPSQVTATTPATTTTATTTRDSDSELTMETPVSVYKSDAPTREFFKEQIGERFHFTQQLNLYREECARKGIELTYGDLVTEWLEEESRRRDPNYRSTITRTCEYNQFIRDFHADPANKGAGFRTAVDAWNITRERKGERTYVAYLNDQPVSPKGIDL